MWNWMDTNAKRYGSCIESVVNGERRRKTGGRKISWKFWFDGTTWVFLPDLVRKYCLEEGKMVVFRK